MIILKPGQRLNPGQSASAEGLNLIYQTDGNLVVYKGSNPLWANMKFASAGYTEMQVDGNLVSYDINGSPYWDTRTFVPMSILDLSSKFLKVVAPSDQWVSSEFVNNPEPQPEPIPGVVKQLQGEVLPFNRSFKDSSGPRYIHGCTDFGAIIKHHEDRDESLRSLDITAAHQQFIRVAYRLNGSLWAESGLTLDPIRDLWWESTCLDFLTECNNRNLRVNLTCADMFNWTNQQARDSIQRIAQIAASVGPNSVMLHEWNEIRGTSPDGESAVEFLRELTGIWQSVYPTNLRGLSDPGSQDKVGMKNLSQNPANIAMIHNVRWNAIDAMRRAFNIVYENYPDKPIDENEPTGPENPTPSGQFNRKVYQPTENHDDLLGIYTTHIMTGQISTYFNDPALYSRYPLDSTWGFKELPALWRQMEIPENIGQGALIPGHRSNAPVKLTPGPADARADSVVVNNQSFTRVCGNANIVAGKSGTLTAFRANGVVLEKLITEGEAITVTNPAILRIR